MKAIILLIAVVLTTACEWSGIDGQNEGVWVEKPMFFGHGGVYGCEEPGKVIHFWTTAVTEITRAPVKITEGFEDITATDNVPIDFDAYITLELIHCEGYKVITEYGGYDAMYENKIKDVFRIETRNRARSQTSIELRTSTEVVESVQRDLLAKMRKYVEVNKMPVRISKIVLGKAIPPKEVLEQAALTAAERQRKSTMDEFKKAEDARKNAETSRALADNAYRKTLGLSADQYIRLREIEMVANKKGAQIIWSSVPTLKTL